MAGKFIEKPGTFAIPALIEKLKDNSYDVRYKASQDLIKIGKPAVPFLIPVLDDKRENMRKFALVTLAEIRDSSAIPRLLKLAKDNKKDGWMRSRALDALSSIGKPAIPALISALNDKDADMRRSAAQSLGTLKDASVVRALINALKDVNGFVRGSAVQSLGWIKASPAIPNLIKILEKDIDADVRINAARALEQFPENNSAIIALQEAARADKNFIVRAEASNALFRLKVAAVPRRMK